MQIRQLTQQGIGIPSNNVPKFIHWPKDPKAQLGLCAILNLWRLRRARAFRHWALGIIRRIVFPRQFIEWRLIASLAAAIFW
jgi:hypothetical protein